MAELQKKLWSKIIVRHICYWMAAFTLMYLIIFFFEGHSLAIKIASVLLIPAPLTVYLHFFVLRRFFEKRRYLIYIFLTIAIILMTEVTVQCVHGLIDNDPNSSTSGSGAAVLYILFSTGVLYYSRGLKQQYRIQEIESKQLQTELALLKSQINPHFFFNTLNNLYSLSLDKSGKVPSVILDLSELMRYALDSSSAQTAALIDEIHFMENYVELEKLRLDDKHKISLTANGDFSGYQIAPMLLIPFLENSFKHGLNSSSTGGYIKIVAEIEEDVFRLSIENSKQSETADAEPRQGMGLANVTRRLEMLYPGRHTLNIENRDNSFSVKLRVQL